MVYKQQRLHLSKGELTLELHISDPPYRGSKAF